MDDRVVPSRLRRTGSGGGLAPLGGPCLYGAIELVLALHSLAGACGHLTFSDPRVSQWGCNSPLVSLSNGNVLSNLKDQTLVKGFGEPTWDRFLAEERSASL